MIAPSANDDSVRTEENHVSNSNGNQADSDIYPYFDGPPSLKNDKPPAYEELFTGNNNCNVQTASISSKDFLFMTSYEKNNFKKLQY